MDRRQKTYPPHAVGEVSRHFGAGAGPELVGEFLPVDFEYLVGRERESLTLRTCEVEVALMVADVDAVLRHVHVLWWWSGFAGQCGVTEPRDRVDFRVRVVFAGHHRQMQVWGYATVRCGVRVDAADALPRFDALPDADLADDVAVFAGSAAVAGGVVDDEPTGGVGSAVPARGAGEQDGAAGDCMHGEVRGAAFFAEVGAGVESAVAWAEG